MSAETVSETPLPVVLQLPAHLFAAAWLNVALAASDDDKGRPERYRAVRVEVHGHTVRLAALDGLMLLHTTVGPDWETPPPIDADPDLAVVVLDPDLRMKALMTWLLKATKDDEDATVEVRIGPEEIAQLPLGDMARTVVTVETARERLTLDTWDGEVEQWRNARFMPAPAAGMSWNPDLLARFSKMKDTLGPVTLQFGGLGMVACSVTTTAAPIAGFVMTIREDD